MWTFCELWTRSVQLSVTDETYHIHYNSTTCNRGPILGCYKGQSIAASSLGLLADVNYIAQMFDIEVMTAA